jgi:hypothetical protein
MIREKDFTESRVFASSLYYLLSEKAHVVLLRRQ